jgi:hypothetical protein
MPLVLLTPFTAWFKSLIDENTLLINFFINLYIKIYILVIIF